MLDIPFKLFPPAFLAGITIYCAVAGLWLQPLVERRIAHKYLVPQCAADLQKIEAALTFPDNPKQRELQILMTYYRKTGLDKLPWIKETMDMLSTQLDATKPTRLRVSSVERTTICSCSVEEAYSQIFAPMLIHVASLRTHEPTSVTKLPKTVERIARSGVCGELPWIKK